MCSAATCHICGKITWTGCGQHVDQVMRGIPEARRCPGHDDGRGTGLLSRLFAR